MLFNSLQFLLFLPIVVLVFYFIPNKFKQLWLLVASYYFYMCWNAKYGLLILFSTVITYLCGIIIEKLPSSNSKRIKTVLTLGISINLIILFYFKYLNFALSIVSSILGKLHVSLTIPTFDILLPVGISFYTFQALGYVIDVYRGDIKAERNFVKYALFVSFFPQLVAGPIERSKNLLSQLTWNEKMPLKRSNFQEGFLIILWGFFLKIVIADRIASFVDTIYNSSSEYSGAYFIVASILFAFQIYCDFYGYSSIAKGSARLLGIELMENFDAPYLQTTVAGFWKQWHISLTSWFRDYLYIPLGGNRKGNLRKYINIMIVFLISGLWHGANLSFVIWGGINGLYQVIGDSLKKFRKKIRKAFDIHIDTIGYKVIATIITFFMVDFAWIFFRANSFKQSLSIVKSIFTTYNPWVLFDGSLFECGLDRPGFLLLGLSLLILLFADIMKKRGLCIRHLIIKQDDWCRCIIYVSAMVFLLIFGVYGSNYDASAFIYFQF